MQPQPPTTPPPIAAARPLIRPATVADVPHVLPMVRAICDLHEARDPERFRVLPDVIARYASWLPERAQDPRSVFVVAQDSSSAALLGFAVCTIEPEVPIFWVPECGWIHDLWVEPAARRRGIAQGMIDLIAQRFTSLGITQIRLHTAAFNDDARTLFSRSGFRPCVVEMLRTLPAPATQSP